MDSSITEFMMVLKNLAAKPFNESAVSLLLQSKPPNVALADIRDKVRLSPLHVAAQFSNVGLVRYLIENGCKVDDPDISGGTPLLYASCHSDLDSDSFRVVQFLINSGASIYTENTQGLSPFKQACATPDIIKSRVILAACAGTYIDAGILAGVLLAANWTLHQVIELRDVELTRCMIQRGANVNSLSSNNRAGTPLHRAAPSRFSDLFGPRFGLYDFGLPDFRSETPLHRAAQIGDSDQVELLLQYRADPSLVDRSGRPPLLDAVRCHEDGAARCIELLLRHGRGVFLEVLLDQTETEGSALLQASADCNIGSVKALLENGVNVNYVESNGLSALEAAFFKYEFSLYPTNTGDRVLKGDRKGLVQLLLKHGADVTDVVLETATDPQHLSANLFALEALLEHIAKLEFSGKKVLSLLREGVERTTILHQYAADHYNNCWHELEKMSETRIFREVRMLNVLLDDFDRVVEHARLETLITMFETEFVKKEFPIYAEELVRRFNEAMKTRNLLDNAIETLCCTLPMPHGVAEKIIRYFDLKDLHTLIQN